MPTLNVTHTNIEHHAKTAKTKPKPQTETKTALKAQTEN
jgi:hypothetical protein